MNIHCQVRSISFLEKQIVTPWGMTSISFVHAWVKFPSIGENLRSLET